MISTVKKHQHGVVCRTFSAILVFIFSFGVIIPPHIAEAQVIPMLPLPGAMVVQTSGYVPALIKGITIHPNSFTSLFLCSSTKSTPHACL